MFLQKWNRIDIHSFKEHFWFLLMTKNKVADQTLWLLNWWQKPMERFVKTVASQLWRSHFSFLKFVAWSCDTKARLPYFCARWVPKILSEDNKKRCMTVSFMFLKAYDKKTVYEIRPLKFSQKNKEMFGNIVVKKNHGNCFLGQRETVIWNCFW